MAYYSCNYRIPVTVETGDYSVSLDNSILFSGEVKAFDNDKSVTVDISPICRQVLAVDFTSVMEDVIAKRSNSTTITTTYGQFAVSDSSDNSLPQYIDVIYDYNTDFKTSYDSFPTLLDPICRKVIAGQAVFACSLSTSGTTVVPYIASTDTIDDINSATGINYQLYEKCLNFALYYVNKYGGLDVLACGKCTESWDGSNTDAELYSLRSSMLDTEKVRIKSDITHSYSITTLPLLDAEAGLIDNLIFSPQVFLHDIEANTIRAVVIDTSSVSRKYSRYDKAPYYSLTVKESQYQHRQ